MGDRGRIILGRANIGLLGRRRGFRGDSTREATREKEGYSGEGGLPRIRRDYSGEGGLPRIRRATREKEGFIQRREDNPR